MPTVNHTNPAVLCGSGREGRGVKRIPAMRGDGITQLGDYSVRTRRTPDINFDASSIGDMISLSEFVSDPPLTFMLSTSEVKRFINIPMEVPNRLWNTQNIERVV
jgi:hypothetical protein